MAEAGAGGWRGTWLHEPRHWRVTGEGLVVDAEAGTDFWRLTHDGAIRHTGHLYGQPVSGDFRARVCVRGEYRSLYDQVGLMIMADERNWLKAGVELVGAIPYASAVVTRDSSDWSLVPAPNPGRMWFQLVRHGATVEVSISGDGNAYALFRQVTLTDGPLQIGPFCASPGAGFTAVFEQFSLVVG